MMNVVSYSFFRSEHSGYESANAGVARGIFFLNFIRVLVRAHWAVWGEDWQLRIHHDDRVQEFPCFKALQRMEAAGLLKLVDCGKAETLCGSMLWRLRPVWDPEVEEFVSHPDHPDVHAILDSESHSGPLMGGMTAFNAHYLRAQFVYPESFNTAAEAICKDRGIDLNRHGADQRILNALIWPRAQDGTLIHQKRQDIAYPDALETRPVAPKVHPLDKLVHIGADYPNRKAIEACEVQA
jgi:hypothetical protein